MVEALEKMTTDFYQKESLKRGSFLYFLYKHLFLCYCFAYLFIHMSNKLI